MPDILALLLCLQPWIPATTARQVSRITLGMLAMTGRVTLVGSARWTGDGGSSRPSQRFVATARPWAPLCWCFFRQHLVQTAAV